MRYEKGRKAATKERILDVASRRFRAEGVAAVGLTGIMSEAGLTNGGFYSHFESKEDLVRETLVSALDGRELSLRSLGQTEDALEQAVRGYLNAEHRDSPGLGCPSAALLAEIGRQPEKTRQAYTARLNVLIDLIADKLPNPDSTGSRATATAMFGLMVGTLQLARAVSEPKSSDAILEAGVQGALILAKAPPR
ncbi:TetR/AcrR family transcriptional regulator [Lichenihabitans sp. PAMC28606]|uniref:TetR/AcrR family transcriptional regulator n=1 Tax=Lichenihabitans sp. PAMC28606 TaxID=2880932 RepID=UPI001D09F77D|nr:TetR/AcrR family transcriptional regulator [Lichenihabitans sp. PAMC28606]UDL95620.1 TetR/AcrR family transcriptional regulator [Lichenihabitans sp. PAMC28606]